MLKLAKTVASWPGLACLTIVLFIPSNSDADIVITSRESYSELSLQVQAGGAVSSFFDNQFVGSINGSLDFAASSAVSVSESDAFSLGSGSASGTIHAEDDLITFGSQGFVVTANRDAGGSAIYGSGSATSSSLMRHYVLIDFSVMDDDVQYSLTGNFNPGDSSNGDNFSQGVIRLGQRFGQFEAYRYDTLSTLSSSGTLVAGQDYLIEINMSDSLFASNGNTFESDASSLNFQLTVGNVSSVPEPNSAVVLGLLGLTCLYRRRRSDA